MDQKEQYRSSDPLQARKGLYAFIEGPSLQDSLSEALALAPGMRVLDVGCGYGDRLIDLLNRHEGMSGTGIDVSEGMIEEARQRSADDARVRFLAEDADRFSPDERFDRIVAVHVLHLVPNPRATVERLLTLLKPDGLLAAIVHSDLDQPKKTGWDAWFAKETGSAYTEKRRNLSLERMNEKLTDLKAEIRGKAITQPIRLRDADPYLRNLDTTRPRWQPIVTDLQWASYLGHAGVEIETDIAANEFFEEISVNGMITMKPYGIDT